MLKFRAVPIPECTAQQCHCGNEFALHVFFRGVQADVLLPDCAGQQCGGGARVFLSEQNQDKSTHSPLH